MLFIFTVNFVNEKKKEANNNEKNSDANNEEYQLLVTINSISGI